MKAIESKEVKQILNELEFCANFINSCTQENSTNEDRKECWKKVSVLMESFKNLTGINYNNYLKMEM